MEEMTRSKRSIEMIVNKTETKLPFNDADDNDSTTECDDDSWDFFFDNQDEDEDEDVRATPTLLTHSSRSLLEQCPLDPIPEDSPYDNFTKTSKASSSSATATRTTTIATTPTSSSRHLQSSRLAFLALVAVALTVLTAQSTFHSRKRTLVVKGVHLTRGGIRHVPRTFTNARGLDFTLPRGVPLPPPLLSSLCASQAEGEECGNRSTADCSWCGAIDRCVPSAFSPAFCKERNVLML
ncbi:hypothetical protein ACHAXS_001494 [Conticribra weissflogii]